MTGFKSSPEVRRAAYRAALTANPSAVALQTQKGIDAAAGPIAAEAFRAGEIVGREQAREAVEELIEQNETTGTRGRAEVLKDALAVLGERNEEETK